jgi:Holliday junction resolvase-like predicted endonuclease
MSFRQYGDEGESLTLDHYLQQGYELVAQNYEYRRDTGRGRLGEIDLLMTKNNILYLIECKRRKNLSGGFLEGLIPDSKLRHLYSSLQYFLLKEGKPYKLYPVQFDLAIIIGDKVQIIPNATTFEKFLR